MSLVEPTDDYAMKARHLRALYRDAHPKRKPVGSRGFEAFDQGEQAEHARLVQAEYDRLLPEGVPRLDQITVNVWIEERELDGQTYDYAAQRWRGSSGERVG